MTHVDNVHYITEIVTGLEKALSEETIRELYEEYKEYINKYNMNIDIVIVKPKVAKHYYQHPVTLAIFKYAYLRPVIIDKLVHSDHSTYFEDLTTEDMVTIIGPSVTKDTIFKMEAKIHRVLSRKEYQEKFIDIRTAIEALKEVEHTIQMRH